MNRWLLVSTFLLTVGTSFLHQNLAIAAQRTSLVVGLGEALSPSKLQLTYKDLDFTIASLMVGFGNRIVSKNNFFVGAGLGYHDSIGYYGTIGKQFELGIVVISLELTGFGDAAGYAAAKSYINLGCLL